MRVRIEKYQEVSNILMEWMVGMIDMTVRKFEIFLIINMSGLLNILNKKQKMKIRQAFDNNVSIRSPIRPDADIVVESLSDFHLLFFIQNI